MARVRLLGAGLLVWLVVSCGGNVGTDSGSKGGSGGKQATDGGGGSAGGLFPGTPLDECVPGFRRSERPDLPCPWLGEGLCYSDKDAACACVCPRDKSSICLSGFPSSDGTPVEVDCR